MGEQKRVSDLLQPEKPDWFQEHVVANAPMWIAIFANFVVIFADYRVYDVMYQLSHVWWKALSASLACAIPFILWEIAWQYNHTTENWRLVSLLMAGVAFGTSIVLGVADYVGFTSDYADLLLGGVVILTGAHTVIGFLYYYNDPDVARKRRKAQALAKMQDQQINADVAKQLLENGNTLLEFIRSLEGKYDVDDVERVLAILEGRKVKDKPRQQSKQQQISYASESKREDFTQGGQAH